MCLCVCVYPCVQFACFCADLRQDAVLSEFASCSNAFGRFNALNSFQRGQYYLYPLRLHAATCSSSAHIGCIFLKSAHVLLAVGLDQGEVKHHRIVTYRSATRKCSRTNRDAQQVSRDPGENGHVLSDASALPPGAHGPAGVSLYEPPEDCGADGVRPAGAPPGVHLGPLAESVGPAPAGRAW